MKYYTTRRQIRLMLVILLHFATVVTACTLLGWSNGATIFGLKIGLILGALIYVPMLAWYGATLLYFLFWASEWDHIAVGEVIPREAKRYTDTPANIKNTGESKFIYTRTKSLEVYDGQKILHTQHVFFVSEATELMNKEVTYIRKDRLIFILYVK